MVVDFFNTAAWQLIIQTDAVSKCIMGGLLSLSIICVAVIIFKSFELRSERLRAKILLKHMRAATTFNELEKASKMMPDGVAGQFLRSTLEDVQRIKNMQSLLTERQVDFIDMKINQHLSSSMLSLERYLSLLSSSGSVSPLIGLFGTVWGLIHAFIDISAEKTADIATVAPGIAEALLTTLAGLVVAIPALVAFNYFSSELRTLDACLLEVSDHLIATIRLSLQKEDVL